MSMTNAVVDQVHTRTLEVLQQVGLHWPHQESLRYLARAGFDVDLSQGRVRIAPDQIEAGLALAPGAPLYNRDQGGPLSYENGPLLMGAGTGVAVIDPESQRRRSSTGADVIRLVTIQDALPNLDIARPIITATDAPAQHSSLAEYALALCNTSKHVTHRILAPEDVELLFEIGVVIAGSPERLRQRPIFSGMYCPFSPLAFTADNIACMLGFARHGLPVMILSETIPGMNAPPTLLGAVIVTNAEILGTLTILQALFAGTPVIYAGILAVMNMQTGKVTYGGPEMGALNALAGKMARHYGLVSVLAGLRTDAKQADEQAGFEKACNLWPILPVADIVYGLGNLDTGLTCSYDQLVLDDELMGAVRRYLSWRMPEGDGTLEVEEIKQVGPMNHFLTLRHTAQEARRFWRPKFFTRRDFDQWAAGPHDAQHLALRQAQEILGSHRPAPLPDHVLSRIRLTLSQRLGQDYVQAHF
jgi:trimethylamine--corrinoid protein Co-methyltransferase